MICVRAAGPWARVMPAPDFPTGGTIVPPPDGFAEVYRTAGGLRILFAFFWLNFNPVCRRLSQNPLKGSQFMRLEDGNIRVESELS